MATPVYFNPPQQHDHSDRDHPFQLEHLQQLLRCSSPSHDHVHEAAADAAAAIYINSADQRLIKFEESQQQQHQKADHCAADGGSSSDIEASIQPNYKMVTMMSDIVITNSNLPVRKRETEELRSASNNAALSSASSSAATTTTSASSSSAKWTPSKMRLMRKMVCKKSSGGSTVGDNESLRVTRKLQLLHDQYNQEELLHENVRVCSDCNTTTTPLWRSGPHGPKSLCNACGIRRRKARRAKEAAAVTGSAAAAAATTRDQASFTKTELQIKKPRTSHVMSIHQQHQKKKQTPDHHDHQQQQCYDDHDQSRRNLCFNDFAIALRPNNSSALRQVFTQDVEEAALLLMELSYGAFVHTY